MSKPENAERPMSSMLTVAHQWMTLLGFPALVVLGGLYWGTFTAKIDDLSRKVEALGGRIGQTETAVAVAGSNIVNHETRITRLEDRPVYRDEPRAPSPCSNYRKC